MNILMVRHPSVSISPGVCYGQTDVPLAEDYPLELISLRQKLPDLTGYCIYSSPLTRCLTLALDLKGEELMLDGDLLELNFGQWEGRPWAQLPSAELRAWSEDFVTIAPPGGETCQQMMVRVRNFWNRLVAQNQDSLIVTHTGWIRLALAHFLEISPLLAFRLHIDFCGLTRVEFREGQVQLMYINR